MLLTIVAFIVALGLLIAVHEWGHYRVAVACGVKVLRYSVGFGRPLLRWKRKNSDTEFVIAALPLGGYVRMLDEREGPVAPNERHMAFNRKPLAQRAAIVAAGSAIGGYLAGSSSSNSGSAANGASVNCPDGTAPKVNATEATCVKVE